MSATKGISTPSDGYVRFNDDPVNVDESFCSGTLSNTHTCNDLPNELGSRSSLTCDSFIDSGLQASNSEYNATIERHWNMNYHEAAIFLEEGENNEKFDSHPSEPEALPAYLLVHNRWYYGLDLLASLVLMALALGEEPAVPAFKLPIGVLSTIELIALAIIGIELSMKLRWIGWSAILKHKRTMLKCITLLIMFMEAIVVLMRQSSHFRITRALRPIFLVDTRHLGGVRRCIRQILQSLPPIIDMLALIFFFISIYALLGYYLFHDEPSNIYFATLSDSFVSMFVLLTTANFPDVMMPAYAQSKWYSIFFISYLCIVLYILMNLMLAVVYETFTNIEREKFRKLLLHKRQACIHAFRLLSTKNNPNKILFKQFEGLMRYYKPEKSVRDVVLMYAHLKNGRSGGLTNNEFCNLYDAVTLVWEPQYSHIPWYHSAWVPLQNICQIAHKIVTWAYFDFLIYTIILLNGLAMVVRVLTPYPNLEEAAFAFCASWDSIVFLSIFAIEAVLKILGLGIYQYFNSGWNTYDFTVTLGALFGIVIISLVPSFKYVVVLRPLRLLHLYKMKKRYRDILGTLALLTPLMLSTGVVMLVLYYFFAIVGMELFSGYDMRNCCKGKSEEDFYRYSANESSALGYYYLNTFENLATSSVTLFELTVVNNWFILMNGYADVVHPSSRIYFILFYLFTMIVLTIVVASVLEAFRFRIQYKRQTTKKDEEKLLHEEVDLKWDDVQTWIQDFQILEKLRTCLVVGGVATFIGCRPRTRDVLQRRMYRSEISEWMQEAANNENNIP